MAEFDNRPEQTPENPQPPQPEQPQAAAPPPARRRRWPWVAAGILVLLVAIVAALLPAIVSSGWGTGLLLGQVNRMLDGRVAIDDLSIGWRSGAEIRGLRIYQNEALILDVPRASTGITFAQLARGDYYDLGQTSVEVASFVLRRYPDGMTNFHQVFRLPPPTDEPLEVPPLEGTIQLAARGTIEQHLPDRSVRVVHVDRAALNASIADINARIPHELTVVLRVDDQPPGTLLARGETKLFENNVLDIGAISGNQIVELQGVQLAGLTPFLPPDAPINAMGGVSTGRFEIQLVGTPEAFVQGDVQVQQLALAGPALRGDTYRSSQLTLVVPRTVLNRETGRISYADPAAVQPITLTADQFTTSFAINATVDSLSRLAANRAPGDSGVLSLAINANLAALANQLPNLLGFEREIQVTSGQLAHSTNITLQPERATLLTRTHLTDLAGTGPQGPISARPIRINVDATSLGGRGAIPQLRDIALLVESGFATFKGGGPTLEQLAINGQANLGEMHRELSQFLRMGELRFAGVAEFALNTTGSLANVGDATKLDVGLVMRELAVAGLTPEPIKANWTQVRGGGALVRGEAMFITAVNDLLLSLQTGTPEAPTIDLAAGGRVAFAESPTGQAMTVPQFQVTRGRIDLPAAQRELGAIIPALRGDLNVQSGVLTLAGAGSYTDNLLRFTTLSLNGQQIALQRGQGTFGPQDIALQLAAALGAGQVEVTQLSGNLGVAQLKLVEPIVVRSADQLSARGAISLTGQVGPTMAAVEAFQGYAPGEGYNLAGTYTLNQAIRTENQTLHLNGKGTIENFAVGPAASPVFREPQVVFINDVALNQPARLLTISQLAVNMQGSNALSASLSGRVLEYPTQRNFEDMRLLLSYDADQLVRLVLPLLDPGTREQLATLRASGVVRNREFVISGAYPAEPVQVGTRLRQPIEYARANGSLYFDRVEFTGMPAERLEIPLQLSNGRFRTIYPDRPEQFGQPAAFSGGTLDLNGLELMFIGRNLRVTALRPEHRLLDNVAISEQFVNQFLGTTHPLFAGATAVRGRITVTINRLDNLPIDDGLVTPVGKPVGEGTFQVSMTDFAIVNPLTRIIARDLAGLPVGADGALPASIPNAEFRLVPGRAFSSLTMMVGTHAIGFRDGEVRLADNRIVGMNLVVPTQLVPVLREQRFIAAVPTMEIPLSGTLTAPQINIAGAATNLLQRNLTQPDVLRKLMDRDRRPPEQPAPAPAPGEPPPGTIGRTAPPAQRPAPAQE